MPPDRRVFKVADSGSVWRAMAGSPFRFFLSSWPWRSLAYVFSTVMAAVMVGLALLPVLVFPPALVLMGLPAGALERRRLILLERAPVGVLMPPRRPVCSPGCGADWLRVLHGGSSPISKGRRWRTQ
jgi:hypothetical protein